MSILTRRTFLKSGAMGAAAFGLHSAIGGPTRLWAGPPRDLVFRPYPHPSMPAMSFAYLTDETEDPFLSSTAVRREGIVTGEEAGKKKFSVNARWYVEGFRLHLAGGRQRRAATSTGRSSVRGDQFNLNYEFARSREARNRKVREQYESAGTAFSGEVMHLMDLSRSCWRTQPASSRTASGAQSTRTSRCSGLSTPARTSSWSTHGP